MDDQEVADICILRSDDHTNWVVSVCERNGKPSRLAQFATREEASEFALAERDRRRAATGQEPTIQFPDDCPCYRDSQLLSNTETGNGGSPHEAPDPA